MKIETFVKERLGWNEYIKMPSLYFVENSIIGKIIRKLSTIGNHRTHKGHGLNISCKIVLPTCCQAHCSFCFNNLTRKTQCHDWTYFLHNLPITLDKIFENIGNRKISFDITGNEPTWDRVELNKALKILSSYKKKFPQSFEKIVVTTNGYGFTEYLAECMFKYNVDIVNISMHSTCYKERMEIFNTMNIPNNEKIVNIVRNLKRYGIKTTSVAVIYKPIENFENYIKEFSINSKCIGFDNTRIRINYTGDVETKNQFYDNFKKAPIDVCPGLMTKFLDFDNYKTNIYLGVKDLTEYVLGSEVILDDDGNLYLDYYKRNPLVIGGELWNKKLFKQILNSIIWNPKIWWDENKLENGTK